MTTTIDLSRVDILDLICREVHLRRKASTHGGEYAGPCPWCGGRDRFRVWPEQGRYWCRQCDKKGDAIQYLRDREGLSFDEACERLNVAKLQQNYSKKQTVWRAPATPPPPPPHERLSAPGPTWQAAAWAFVSECEAALWADVGAKALAWLRGRGLADKTIKAARLGYNERDRHQKRLTWGLDADGHAVWLPRAVVIPWMIGGELWRVDLRRPVGKPKYVQPSGCSLALYNADALTTDRPAVLVEGALDALTIGQQAGDLVTPVAAGTTTGARRTRWIARLALCPLVLVATDADEGGDGAAAYWLGVLDKAKRWRPFWDDANTMAQGGADLRAWLAAGLGNERAFAGQADAVDPAAELIRQLRAEPNDRRWCDLLGELNRALCAAGELEPTYTLDGAGGQVFVTYGCEELARPRYSDDHLERR